MQCEYFCVVSYIPTDIRVGVWQCEKAIMLGFICSGRKRTQVFSLIFVAAQCKHLEVDAVDAFALI